MTWDWKQRVSPLHATLTTEEADQVQDWLCRRDAQLRWPAGTRRRTDTHPPVVSYTLTEWRQRRGWSMNDLLNKAMPLRAKRMRTWMSLETIRRIENGTSDWRHYKAIECIVEALGIRPEQLQIDRKYARRTRDAA